MELQYKEVGPIRMIKVIGKLDLLGTEEIETGFAGYCAGDGARVLVDLSEVDYLASTGIRLLTTNAKSLASRRGRMVLLRPNANVKSTLEMTGIPSIIPMYDSFESAEAVLLAR